MCKRDIGRLPPARPQGGTWPATQARVLTGNQTGDLSVYGMKPNPLSHPSQGFLFLPFLSRRNSLVLCKYEALLTLMS